MAEAFLYLTRCTIRNSVRLRLRRLRQARYLVIAVGIVLYLGVMLSSRPASGVLTIAPAYRQPVDIAAMIVATVLLGLAWVLPNSLALQFTSAEVQLLFPAPVTRRQLIGYKIWRLLLGAVATSLLFTLFVAPPRPLPAAGFAGRTFVVLAVMALYQAGVSLHRKRTEEGAAVRRSRRMAIAAFPVVGTPAAGWVLARVALAPAEELVHVLPLAAALLVACGLWVLQSDAAFEEAAAESAEKVRLATKGGYTMRPRLRANRSSSFTLAPQGPVETAILWKNWMLIGRASRPVIFAGIVVLVSLMAGFWFAGGFALGRSVVGVLCFALAAALLLFGPAMLRIDLRQDLAYLAIIKTWPVRGAAVFRGELLAPFIALVPGVSLPILLGSALDDTVLLGQDAAAAARAVFAIAALLVCSTLLLAQLVIQNGIAVTFPAWVRLTPGTGVGGIEMIGQMMITLYGGMFALVLAAVVPAGTAAAVWFVLGGSWTAPLIASLVFTAILTVECAAATEVFGRILDRADLQDVATVE